MATDGSTPTLWTHLVGLARRLREAFARHHASSEQGWWMLSRLGFLAAAALFFIPWHLHLARENPRLVLYYAVGVATAAAMGKACSKLARRGEQRRRDRRAQAILSGVLESAPAGSPRLSPVNPQAPDYALYLRPFSSTGSLEAPNPLRRWLPIFPAYHERERFVELETEMAQALDPFLPLIGLGRPGEHIGAGRIAVADREWRQAFARLAGAARWVIMLPAQAGETLWELEWLRDHGLLARTVFLMPPGSVTRARGSDGGGRERWAEMTGRIRQLGVPMPDHHDLGMLFRVTRPDRAPRSRLLPRASQQVLRGAFMAVTRASSPGSRRRPRLSA